MFRKIVAILILLLILNGYILTSMFDYYKSIYSKEISLYKQRINKLEEVVDEFKLEGLDVTVTMYHPTRQQTDSTPNITADGTKFKTWRATDYRYVALSRDLISRWGGPFEYGDYIVIEGTGKWDGIYQVRDTMNPKWVNRVDILTTDSRFKYNDITMYKYVDEYEIVDNS